MALHGVLRLDTPPGEGGGGGGFPSPSLSRPGREHFPHRVPSFPSGTICCLSSTLVPISQQRLPSDLPPGEECVHMNVQGLNNECREILEFFFFLSVNFVKHVSF